MRDLYRYSFESELSLAEVLQRFRASSSWRWIERESDAAGDYVSARALQQPHEGMVKLYFDPAPDHYEIDVKLHARTADARRLFYEVRDVVFDQLLPAVGARDVAAVEDSSFVVLRRIPGGTLRAGLTNEEADDLAIELGRMEQTLLSEREALDGESEFSLSESIAVRRSWLETSMPVLPVEIEPFEIDAHPVTVGEYALYVEATGAARPEGFTNDHPLAFVTGISWREAAAFAEYHGLSLPTEFEWELAARDGRSFFPWGNEYFPQGRRAFPSDFCDDVRIVGSRPETGSVHGVHELIGEHREFCAGRFAPYPGADLSSFERRFPDWRRWRVVRGGYDVHQDSTCVFRSGIEESHRARDVKFRCVRHRSR